MNAELKTLRYTHTQYGATGKTLDNPGCQACIRFRIAGVWYPVGHPGCAGTIHCELELIGTHAEYALIECDVCGFTQKVEALDGQRNMQTFVQGLRKHNGETDGV